MLYYIVPRVYGTTLYSRRLANVHFWLATLGILFYAIPLYVGGITQSLMWREFAADGTLRYANFLETVVRIVPMYALRAIGGTLFTVGGCVAIYNFYRTAGQGAFVADEAVSAPPMAPLVVHAGAGAWHRALESRPAQFAVLTLVAVVIGGVVEFLPTALVRANVPTIASVRPYTPLEIEGRDLYIREGCVGCHSQMVRPIRAETERYGEYSKAGEYVYDHPFLWGSKRTGPDLHRVGGKYPDSWHYLHMKTPAATSPGSLMPGYPWLYDSRLDTSHVEGKVITLRRLGVPYPLAYEKPMLRELGLPVISAARLDLETQAARIAAGLAQSGMNVEPDREIVALIAYLQRLGTDIKAPDAAAQTIPATAGAVAGRGAR
jgi:cytochrome c oxidase cbb3-type subunit I/II